MCYKFEPFIDQKVIMRHFTISIGLLILTLTVFGQTVEETYPKTLWCDNDIFAIKYGGFPDLDTFKVSRTDKTSPGFDAKLNAYAIIYYNSDSLRINYNNKLPYQHNYYINFESPKGKTTLRFHFNELTNYFDKEFIEKNEGQISFAIPEVYELANIIWTLSPSGQKATDLNKEGEYYKKILAYFKPFQNHPVFKSLSFPDSIYGNKYYDFRENSFAFNFKNPKEDSSLCKLLFNGPYYYVYGNELADSSLFGKLKPLVEDFAIKSKFRKFYKANFEFYKKEIQRQAELMPIKKMWDWLEIEFPKIKYNSYKIIFSPLIRGSHSTQNYSSDIAYPKYFREAVMFVCGPERYDANKELTEKQKEGLLTGIVFTEIDHNYVNPTTAKYSKQIDSIFSNRKIWAQQGNGSDFYTRPISVFNEYMTHSVFCLYIYDTYDKETAEFIIRNRESIMVDKRNFIRFKEFDTELLRLRQENKNLKVVELYPLILHWCKIQQ
ncbi:MAG: hypothetical protein ABJA37_03765 [Ferruginibacter sp.]